MVAVALKNITIHFEFDSINGNTTFLNGVNIEKDIRTLAVSNLVSPVSAISAVRKAMVAQQRKMGDKKGIVMDGRDIGTVVFPKAELKLFMTADFYTRTKRRFDELSAKNALLDMQSVADNLKHRDNIDSNRLDSPLSQAEDAILLDNTHLDEPAQFNLVLNIIKTKINLV
jgi:cytidylate kinase